ncbi:MAG: peroxiredoxin [Gammaproteobacteria bacterium]
MTKLKIGNKVKNFKLPSTGGKIISLNELKGNNIVVYFYPKDNTPGCTKESEGFRDAMKKFTRLNTIILGVSRDSIKSHENFKSKLDFSFDLLSDSEEKLCQQFDVIKEKNMYGKKVMGIERSTFLIDDKGVLRQEWRKVKVDGHVEEVLIAVKSL